MLSRITRTKTYGCVFREDWTTLHGMVMPENESGLYITLWGSDDVNWQPQHNYDVRGSTSGGGGVVFFK